MKRQEITQEQLDVIATYMNDELRERLHGTVGLETPRAFLEAYLATGEDLEMIPLLKSEFPGVYKALGYN